MLQQQHARGTVLALKSRECRGLFEAGSLAILENDLKTIARYLVVHRVAVRALGKREVLIQKISRKCDDPCTALRVVLAATRRSFLRNRISAVERVVQAAPAGVGRIEGVAGIADRHHQSRTGYLGAFRIDVCRADNKGLSLSHQIAYLAQKSLVFCVIEARTGILSMPGVDLFLERSEERRVGKEWRSRWS